MHQTAFVILRGDPGVGVRARDREEHSVVELPRGRRGARTKNSIHFPFLVCGKVKTVAASCEKRHRRSRSPRRYSFVWELGILRSGGSIMHPFPLALLEHWVK